MPTASSARPRVLAGGRGPPQLVVGVEVQAAEQEAQVRGEVPQSRLRLQGAQEGLQAHQEARADLVQLRAALRQRPREGPQALAAGPPECEVHGLEGRGADLAVQLRKLQGQAEEGAELREDGFGLRREERALLDAREIALVRQDDLVEVRTGLPVRLQLGPGGLEDLAHHVGVDILDKVLHLVAQARAPVQRLAHLQLELGRAVSELRGAGDEVALERHVPAPAGRQRVRHAPQPPEEREGPVVLPHRSGREDHVQGRVHGVVQEEDVPAALAGRGREQLHAQAREDVGRAELGVGLPHGHVHYAQQLVPLHLRGAPAELRRGQGHEALGKVPLAQEHEAPQREAVLPQSEAVEEQGDEVPVRPLRGLLHADTEVRQVPLVPPGAPPRAAPAAGRRGRRGWRPLPAAALWGRGRGHHRRRRPAGGAGAGAGRRGGALLASCSKQPVLARAAEADEVHGLAREEDLARQLQAHEARDHLDLQGVHGGPQVLQGHGAVGAHEELSAGVLQLPLRHPGPDHGEQGLHHPPEDRGAGAARGGVADPGEAVDGRGERPPEQGPAGVAEAREEAHAPQRRQEPGPQAAQGQLRGPGLRGGLGPRQQQDQQPGVVLQLLADRLAEGLVEEAPPADVRPGDVCRLGKAQAQAAELQHPLHHEPHRAREDAGGAHAEAALGLAEPETCALHALKGVEDVAQEPGLGDARGGRAGAGHVPSQVGLVARSPARRARR
eukprot:CAMPEP_0175555960 /NCGR_PEP_ID=MMETSP0096-20121207/34626_1 /TAXON_ID=311494 /ORGANISM="Alexandrium monilatum, Strain CCMP3105" /LENGTH=726 /DNA_ID=CAMNT_0016859089 /DNA_START=8 /DNA_END=2184 /DNA_ORIENTATION=-